MQVLPSSSPVSSRSRRCLLALVAPLLLSSCTSLGTAPENLAPDVCSAPPGLAGVWKSDRDSQVGPAHMTLHFRCDCTYGMQARLLGLVRFREEGAYWTEAGQLRFSRASGEITSWSYTLEDDVLTLEEAPAEKHLYRHAKNSVCDESE